MPERADRSSLLLALKNLVTDALTIEYEKVTVDVAEIRINQADRPPLVIVTIHNPVEAVDRDALIESLLPSIAGNSEGAFVRGTLDRQSFDLDIKTFDS